MRVLIAGVASFTGRLLAERLIAGPGHAVIGVDAGPCFPPVAGLRFVRCPLDRPEWLPALSEVNAVVLLNGLVWPSRRTRARRTGALVADSQAVIRATVAAGVSKLLVATSAALYGPQPAGVVLEGAQVRGHQAGDYARERAQIEDYLDILAGSGYNGVLTRLRSAWVSGPHHLALVHSANSGPVLACGYENQPLPVVHEEDLIAALALALRDDLPGVYHVAAAEPSTLWEVVDLVGGGRACQPLPWLVLRAWWGWRFRGRRTPPGWFRALYQGRPLDTRRLRAAGWTPQRTAREALIAALDALRAGS